MSNKVIQLKRPVNWFDKPLTTIELKEPSALDFITFGEVTTYVKGRDNSVYAIENDQVIHQYLDKLLVVDGGISVLAVLTIVDGMQIKNGLLGFFGEAAKELSGG